MILYIKKKSFFEYTISKIHFFLNLHIEIVSRFQKKKSKKKSSIK